jgi:lipoate-protein ligase A
MGESAQIWRLLPYSAAKADDELARGEALLTGMLTTGRPAVRWYGATQRALVIGSGQRLGEVDSAALRHTGVNLHRRASGGTAVLFVPGLLMQDLALPPDHPLYCTDITSSYAWLGAVWVEVLTRLGLSAVELVPVPTARTDTLATDDRVRRACFGGRSPYEVIVGGRKLVGFSQIRRRAGALFQVGLYSTWPGEALTALLRLTDEERSATSSALAARVVGLDELLPLVPEPALLMATFADVLAQQHGVMLEPVPWSDAEEAAAQIAAERYRPIDPGSF